LGEEVEREREGRPKAAAAAFALLAVRKKSGRANKNSPTGKRGRMMVRTGKVPWRLPAIVCHVRPYLVLNFNSKFYHVKK
jgi:hypothetical protein